MKFSAKMPAMTPRVALLPAAVLAVFFALILLTDDKTYAQSETAASLAAPQLSATADGAGAIELRWDAVTGAAGYDLRAWWAGQSDWQRIGEGILTGTTYRHAPLTAGTTYHYLVRAVDAGGAAGAWSNQPSAVAQGSPGGATSTLTPTSAATATATPGGATSTFTPTATSTSTADPNALTVPSVPVLRAQATAGGVVLSWQAVSGAERYELLAWFVGASDWQPIGGANLTGTTYTHADATAGTTYHYTIRALNAAGASGWLRGTYPSAVAQAVTGAGTSTPTSTATATATPGGATATPTITAAATATATPTITLTATATAAALTVPSVPVLRAQATAGGVVLSWEAVSGAERYELLAWFVGASDWQAIGGANLTGTTYTHADATAGTTYHYTIRALNAAGASGWLRGTYPSAVAQAVTGGATPTATVTPTAGPTVATTERGALIALYEATDGDNWTRNDNWLSDAPLDSWYGVTTDPPGADGVVTALRLPGNNLRGTLPDLSALTNLKRIVLPANRLQGTLPDLSALTKLEALVLGGNDLSGSLPDLSALTKLEDLALSLNDLSGPLPDLSALTNLKYLQMYDNRLNGPIPDLSALVNLEYMNLRGNRLSGSIPDLSALTQLRELRLFSNDLSGEIPDLSALSELRALHLAFNELSGSIPDLSALDRLEWISLAHNELTGPFPALSASARMTQLNFSANQLSGPFPDLGAFTSLWTLELNDNRFSGPVFDLDRHYELNRLYLHNNELSGPLPDLSALLVLAQLDLSGNDFCLPAGASTSLVHSDADAHLKSLDLQPCTAADLAGYPAEPANLSATVQGSQVTVSWDAVADAAGYELRVWDSLDRSWGSVGGVLTGTSYTHSVLTDGRNYYFQVRARDAAGVRGPWSDHAHAIIVAGRYPPPPAPLGIHIFYQKYLEVNGVVVTAPTEVSDEAMAQTRAVVAGMLSGRTAFFENLPPKYLRVAIFKENEAGENKVQIPELGPGTSDVGGGAFPTATAWVAAVKESDPGCRILIHEFAHAIHFALKAQPGGQEFDARIHALYDAALNAGLWHYSYASFNALEYWAETVVFWFRKDTDRPAEAVGKKLEDYDPEIAKLIAETFGEGAYVPSYCKP